jgi:hypothetical protein
MPDHPDVTLETRLSDYCRDEDEGWEETVEQWEADLEAAGAYYRTYDCEVSWQMTLQQAFWLKQNRGWFRDDGFYNQGEGLWMGLTALLEGVGERDGNDTNWVARTLENLWDSWQKENPRDLG